MTMSTRRHALRAIAAATLAGRLPARAAAWPDKPIRMIWPFATGGLGATLARLMADGLTQRLGQSVYVDARPGGGGVLGFQLLKSATPDGYTIMLGTNSTSTLLPSMMKNLPFDPIKDYEHIAMCFTGPNIIVVRAESSIKDFADLRAQAKARPGDLTYGSAGNGSTFHVMPAMFDLLNGSKMIHVPYKGGAPAYMGLLGGDVSVVFGDLSSLTYVRSGKMRALAALSKQRIPAAPEIPTTAELGMPELVMESFYGLFAPKGTPRPIVERLNKEATATLADPNVLQQLRNLTTYPAPDTSSSYFAEQIARENARWRPVIEHAGIVLE